MTRRQGWEAGNIDYMGADSFANIWAKISQTLSKPPTSPPSQSISPPEEPTPAKLSEESIPAQVSEEPKKPEVPVVEEQPEATKIAKEACGETASAADLIPSETDISAPSESAVPSVEPAVEVVTPKESVSATGPGTQDVPIVEPAQAAVSKETIPTVEAIPQPPSSEEASQPTESADISAESSAPVEIPVPVVEAVLAEAAAPESTALITTEEIPAPVLEASVALKSPKAVDVTPEPAAAPVDSPLAKKAEGEAKPVEVTKDEPPTQVTPASAETVPTVTAEAPPSAVESVQSVEQPAKPEDAPVAPATDSPPLANTPSTEEVPTEPAAKCK